MKKLSSKQGWTKEAKQFFKHISLKFQIDEKHHAVFYGTVENLNAFLPVRCSDKKAGDDL